MINLCTISDYSYLAQGLTLYNSLKATTEDFTLHYLATDKQSLKLLRGLDEENLIVYDIERMLSSDSQLTKLFKSEYKYFCWTLSSYFTDFLVNTLNQDLTYIDSDIYFHTSVKGIIQDIGTKDIGLFRHRQYPLSHPNGNGWFNVGVVHFKNTEISRQSLAWWKDAVLHQKYPDLATCGDQRYLDAFVQLDSDNLFIEGNIGHGSPWEWQLYNYDSYHKDGCISWGSQKQKLVFSHFSQFEYSLEEDTYIPSTTHYCFTPLIAYEQEPALKDIYNNYFSKVKETINQYNITKE